MSQRDEYHYAKGQLLFALRFSREMLEDAVRVGPVPPTLDTRVRVVAKKLAELVRDFETEYGRSEAVRMTTGRDPDAQEGGGRLTASG